MADVKPASIRSGGTIATSRLSTPVRAESRLPVQDQRAAEDRVIRDASVSHPDANEALVSEFITPPPRTMAWLGDARIAATLKAASEALAPGGVAEDPADRYAASVIETHLVARQRLNKLTNALLKT